jgi:hypothetical protein
MSNVIYSDSDYESVKSQKKKLKIVLFTVLGIYLLISLAVMIFYLGLPYKSDKIIYAKIIEFTVTGIFIIFMFLFLSLKYKRVKAYYKVLGYINTGIKESNYGEFLRFENTIEIKENVEFKFMIMSEWNQRKSEFFERKVLIDKEKNFPNIKEGEKVKYITQGNILLEYEIVEGEN